MGDLGFGAPEAGTQQHTTAGDARAAAFVTTKGFVWSIASRWRCIALLRQAVDGIRQAPAVAAELELQHQAAASHRVAHHTGPSPGCIVAHTAKISHISLIRRSTAYLYRVFGFY